MKKFLSLLLTVAMLLSLAACGECEHDWEKATCEDPKTCSKCGETKGDPKDYHDWEEDDGKTVCSWCGKEKGDDDYAQDSNHPSDDVVKIALIIMDGDHGFTGESVRHAQMEAEALNQQYAGKVEIVVKSCGEAADQISEIEKLIVTDTPDAIMLWPTHPEALRAAAELIVDYGIPLIIYDRQIENFDGAVTQMLIDHFAIGTDMGHYLNNYFQDYTDVQYLRFVGDASTVTAQRSGGMDCTLDHQFEQVAETFVTNYSQEIAQEQLTDWLNNASVEEIEALDLIVAHDDMIVDGLMIALESYTGEADLSGLKLITSIGGREETLTKFDNTPLDVKLATWFASPSGIRECILFTVEYALGLEYSGNAIEADGFHMLPVFSISNAGFGDYSFEQYRSSDIYAERYSING